MDGITRDIYLRSLALHEAKVTQTSITQLEEETSLLKDDLRTISGKEKLHQLLNMILDNLPDGAVCNSITVDSQTISLNAKTGLRSEVFLFAERLEESGLVSEVRLHSLQDLPGGTEESGQAAMVIFKIEIER